jgi:hypothetical protein
MARSSSDCYLGAAVSKLPTICASPAINRSGAAPLLIAVTVLLFAACGNDSAPGANDPKDTGSDPSFTPDSGGSVPTGDVVSGGCKSNDGCAAPTPTCDVATGKCVQCLTEADCPGGETCQDKNCLPKNCKAGSKQCQDTSNLAICNAAGDGFVVAPCAAGLVCHDAACHATVCKPGLKKCATDGRALLLCNEFGTTFVKKSCSQTETCFAAACKTHVCKPGKKSCGDNNDVKTCNADGLAFTETKCSDGSDGSKPQSCDPAYGLPGAPAFCANQVCAPLKLFCADNQAKKCSADGLQSEIADNCNLNSSSGTPRLCQAGACVELKCKPGSLACLSWASVGKCLEDGQGYKKVPCGQNSVCQGGKCVQMACPAGKTYCEGTVVKNCNAFGTGSSFVIDCATSSQTCFKGGCSKVVCAVGTSKCSGDGKLLQKCGPNGYEYVASPCGADETCLPKDGSTGQCIKQVCSPAKKFCDGAQPKQCNGYGTSASVLPVCTGTAKCHGGVCLKKICTPGELQCKDAGTLQQCALTGVAWEVVGCGAGQICGDKKCAQKLCEPSKAICDGSVAKGCDATGLKFSFQKDCAKDGKNCLNGNCVVKFCGDGTCDKGVEKCSTCEKDCGKCPPTGCTGLPTAGCSGCTCETCVCQQDPNCCSQVWGLVCGKICKEICGSKCTN